MSQKNLPQITKHFQAFLQLYNFCQSLQTILTLTQLSIDHKHLNSIKTSFDDQNRFSGAKITYKNPLFSIYPKNANNSYLGPLVGVSILVHFSLSLSFKKFNLWSAQKLQLIF